MVGVQIRSDTDDYSRVDKRSASAQNKHEATKLKWWGTKLADGYGDAVSRHKTRAHATGLADALRLSALRGVKRQKYLPSVALGLTKCPIAVIVLVLLSVIATEPNRVMAGQTALRLRFGEGFA